MIGIDLFSGAGGMTHGAKLAGVDVRFAVENNVHAAATYRANHPEVSLFDGDIATLPLKWLPTKRRDILLFGGPPCQGFSTSNQRNRNLQNPGNWLFREFFRVTVRCHPKWVVFENVTGIKQTEGGYFLNCAISELERLGYEINHWILNAADYGVPQMRERIFVIGGPKNSALKKPKRTTLKHIPVSDALDDLPFLANGADRDTIPYRCEAKSAYAIHLRGNQNESSGHCVTRNAKFVVARYTHVPQGGNWENIPEGLMKNYADRDRCHTGIYHRLDSTKPSKVIGNFRKNMLIHPHEHRGLSVREAARIQSFPDWYRFHGSIGFRQQQVGNAVPPLLAKAVFTAILAKQ